MAARVVDPKGLDPPVEEGEEVAGDSQLTQPDVVEGKAPGADPPAVIPAVLAVKDLPLGDQSIPTLGVSRARSGPFDDLEVKADGSGPRQDVADRDPANFVPIDDDRHGLAFVEGDGL